MEHLFDTPAGIEARAKIIWGESPEQVSEYLANQSLSHEEINFLINDYVEERKIEIKDAGKSLMVRAAICFVVGITLLFALPGIGILTLLYCPIVGILGFKRYTTGHANGDVGKMTGIFG